MHALMRLVVIGGVVASIPLSGSLYARGGGGGGGGMGSMRMSGGGYGSGSMTMSRGSGGNGFTDGNGDGINDRARDSDGDGIFNGQDPDYVRPQDGTGSGALEFRGS